MSKLRGVKRHCLFRAMHSQMSMGRGLVLHRGVWGECAVHLGVYVWECMSMACVSVNEKAKAQRG